jgi:hypothetical protein
VRILDFGKHHFAACGRDRACGNAPLDDVGGIDLALGEVVGQVHHLAEAVVHDREPAVGAEHAQSVGHVVQRRVELARQRRHALVCDKCADEDALQTGRDLDQREKEHRTDARQSDVVGIAVQRERDRGRTAGERNLDVVDPRSAVGSPGASRHIAGRQRHADHVRDGVVGQQQANRAPGAERDCIDDRANLIANFPSCGVGGSERRSALHEEQHVVDGAIGA